VINLSDLVAALTKTGHQFGAVVNPSDVETLLA